MEIWVEINKESRAVYNNNNNNNNNNNDNNNNNINNNNDDDGIVIIISVDNFEKCTKETNMQCIFIDNLKPSHGLKV